MELMRSRISVGERVPAEVVAQISGKCAAKRA